MRKLLLCLSLMVLCNILAYFVVVHFFNFEPEYPVERLEKGWTVTYRNQQYQNTNLESLSDQVGATLSRGDIITLNQVAVLPDIKAPFPYLIFKTQFCTYEVFINDVLISTTHRSYIGENSFVGIGYNVVQLPSNYPGTRLTIKLYVTENAARADIVSPMIGNYDDLYRTLLHTAIFPFMIGLFLLMFGAVFLVISLLFYMRSSGVLTQILCSFLTVIMGIWILTSFDITDLILTKPVATTLEYDALFLITPFIYLIVVDLHKRRNNTLIIIMGFATLFFSILFMILHTFNIVHINHFQFPYYLISFVGVIFLVIYDYADITTKSKNISQRILMCGLSVLTITLLVYAGAAMLRKVVDYRQSPILNIMITSGAFFFVLMQLLNYFIYMTHSFAQKKEYAALTKIAYVDNLTGLPNRASCDEKLSELDKSENDFCILSLDLNGLKEVNDNAGHPAGDRLLKSFAETLRDVFESKGVCTRIGGDEFLVLIDSIDKEELDKLLVDLDQRLLKLDEEDQEINHSVSYGYAYRHETGEKDTHTVFMLADQRMYDYKRARYAHMMTRR